MQFKLALGLGLNLVAVAGKLEISILVLVPVGFIRAETLTLNGPSGKIPGSQFPELYTYYGEWN